MKRSVVLAVLILVGAFSMAVAGYQAGQGRGEGRGRGPQGPNVAEIEKVRDNLYMLTGGGGNTAVFITDAGVTLVDTKLANWGQAILDKVKTVTNKPVTTIINTHTHGDHNGSNEFFGATVEFVSHENTKANMEKMDAFKGDKSVFIPKKTFKDKLTIGKGKDEIDLFYFGRAHTNGDAWVLFKQDRVLHSGDAFAGKTTPIIDGNNGGSAVDFGKTLATAFSTVGKSADTIITGHSPLMKPSDLNEYAAFNNEFATWVAGQKKAGKSVDDAVAAYKIPDKYPGYQINTFLGGIKNNIQVAYNELK